MICVPRFGDQKRVRAVKGGSELLGRAATAIGADERLTATAHRSSLMKPSADGRHGQGTAGAAKSCRYE